MRRQSQHHGLLYYRISILCLLILLVTPQLPLAQPTVHAAEPHWSRVGLDGKDVEALAINPTNSQIVYAVVDGTSGLYRTNNGGGSWSEIHTYPHSVVALNPQNPSMVYAGLAYEVWKSLDNGDHWVEVASAGASTHRAIVIDPSNPNTVYLGVQDGWGIFKSTTGGAGWTSQLSSQSIISLAMNPQNTQEIYAGSAQYYTTSGGIWKTTNAGLNWTRVLTSTRVNSLIVDPLHPDTVYAATEGEGIFKSTNAGLSWSSSSTGLSASVVRAMAIDPNDTAIVYAGTWEGGVFRSNNGGASWSAMNAGLTNTYILSLIIDPLNPDVLYAGSMGGGIFKLSAEASTPVYSISGTIRDTTGAALSGVTVSDNVGHSTTTNASGAYSLSGLTAGSYTITPTKSGSGFSPASRVVSVPPDSTGQDFDIKPVNSSAGSWTLVLYLAGDNDLAKDMRRAIRELEGQSARANVKVVVLFDGDRSADTRRFIVQPGGSYTTGVNSWSLGELDMGDPQTLISFVSWVRANQPADHYYLAIADHGRGTSGVAWDDHSDQDYLTTTELREALRIITTNGQYPIDILHYDTCLMAMLENVYQVQEYVNYLVASENLGWSLFDYASYYQAVSSTTTARELARAVAERYHTAPRLQSYPRTISALDTSQAVQLRQAVDRLAQALNGKLGTFKSYMQTLRDASQKFDSREYYKITKDDEYIDLYDFAARINDTLPDANVQQAAQGVMDAVDALVIAEYHESGLWDGSQGYWDLDNAHGVSIYFPPRSGSQDYRDYTDHQMFQFSAESQWDELLSTYFSLSGLNPEDPITPERPPMPGSATLIYLPGVQR